ncbi:hypothetical protein AS156_30710 [Bradyrhizobium macuxiense]|uniref:Uncharacterized protein n=1 Tax=Bradyrhizobium macuxiense TaxID=1755647 RepID=A0A109K2R1_9BRAD|nr:hypothetical protein [Bradyrhizobium macuxiense]KWV59623.1 hypothetical protein AS156_30710 [Bradyrhizobium macuxiense]
MTHDDPTDNALAAIASILDQSTTPPERPKSEAKAFDPEEPAVAVALPPPLSQSTEPEPTEPESAKPEPAEPEQSEPEPAQPEQVQPEPIRPIEANGYSKTGPGPMAALRFRWTVREDGGRYYVDETVGEGATPLVNGPMDGDAAIKFVDNREAEAHRRFEHFKREMINRSAPTHLEHKDNDEA